MHTSFRSVAILNLPKLHKYVQNLYSLHFFVRLFFMPVYLGVSILGFIFAILKCLRWIVLRTGNKMNFFILQLSPRQRKVFKMKSNGHDTLMNNGYSKWYIRFYNARIISHPTETLPSETWDTSLPNLLWTNPDLQLERIYNIHLNRFTIILNSLDFG